MGFEKEVIRNIIVSSIVFIVLLVVSPIKIIHSYQWNKEVGGYFGFSDRASDGQTKLNYYIQGMTLLKEQADMNGNAAIFFQTPKDDFAQNYQVLLSLQTRLESLQRMNPTSFEYQQAMLQITGQEYEYFDYPLNVMKIA